VFGMGLTVWDMDVGEEQYWLNQSRRIKQEVENQ